MAFFETRAQREARLARQEQRYPELEHSTFDDMLEVDTFTRQQTGAPLTQFGRDSEDLFARNLPLDNEFHPEAFESFRSIYEGQQFRGHIRPEDVPTPPPDQGGSNFLGRLADVAIHSPFASPITTPLGIGRELLQGDLRGAAGELPGADLVNLARDPQGTLDRIGADILETARSASPPSQLLDLFRERERPTTTLEGAQGLLEGALDIEKVTVLPVQTPIRQGPQQFVTDPIGAMREQHELQQQGGLGFGLEGAAPFEAIRRIPGIERDIEIPIGLGTHTFTLKSDISAFDLTVGLADVLLDAGGIFGLSAAGRAAVQRSAIRNILPSLADDTVLPIQRGASAPGRLNLTAAENILQGPAARNAWEAAQRSGSDTVPSELLRTYGAADVIVQQDKPGMIGDLLNRIPVLRQIREFDQPRFGMPDDILESAVSRQMGMSEFHTKALPSREHSFRGLRNLFGDEAVEGIPTGVGRSFDNDLEFVIDGTRYTYPGRGTIYDIAQRADEYDLTDAQRTLLFAIDDRNLALRTLANDGYGTEIGRFTPNHMGATFMPNIDASDAQRQLDEFMTDPATRAVSGTRSKTRIFDTGYDRWVNDMRRVERGSLSLDEVFVPETDMRKLLFALDGQKANAIGASLWQNGLPGRTLVELKQELSPDLVRTRDSLRRQIDSLRGKVRRAEQSIRRDAQSTRVLERQIAENDARINRVMAQAERTEGGLPELDELRGIIDELELRQRSLSEAAVGPSSRFTRQSIRADELRGELDDVLAQYDSVRRAYENVNLRGEVFVGDGLYRYFPAEDAESIRKISRSSTSKVFELMAAANATTLSADLSPPIGIQGQLAFLLRPADTTVKMFGALNDPIAPFRLGKLADDIAADPEGWERFFFWLGRPPSGTKAVPEELAGGFLGKLPGFNEANEGMYRIALRRMKDDFDWMAQKAIADGANPDEAYAAAIDTVAKVIPTITPTRLGQSAAQATAQRVPFTSIAFLRQPAALVQEGTKALVKMGLRQPLTLREQFARDAVLRIAGTATTMVAVSAYLDAEIKGIDKREHIEDALKGARMHVPGTKFTLPIGAPFRGLYHAVRPQMTEVEGVGKIPMPFAGIWDFFENRRAPVISTQFEVVTNEDYYGNPIRTRDFPVNILQSLLHEVRETAPITAGGIAENVAKGEDIDVILAEAAGDFLGGNLQAAPEFVEIEEAKDAIARSREWTDAQTGDTFRVNSFDELKEHVGSVVADQLVEPLLGEGDRVLLEEQAEEAEELATGVDDSQQAFAQLNSLGQEHYRWALDIQAKLDNNELTLAEARDLEKAQNWNGQISGIIRAFQPVFGETEAVPLDQLDGIDDVDEVRNQYFAYMQQNIDPLTGDPSDHFYDVVEPQFIGAIGEAMWGRVQANIGTRDRAPWQLEIKDIRTRLADAEFFDIRPRVWERVAERNGLDEYTSASEFSSAIMKRILDRGHSDEDALILHNSVMEKIPAYETWRTVSNEVEEIWIKANVESGLAGDALRAGYLRPGSLRKAERRAILSQ